MTHKNLLMLFLSATLGWVALSWHVTKVDNVVQAYKTMLSYENMIIAGNNSDSVRSAYVRASNHIDEVGKNMLLFLLMGLGVPWLALVIGNGWLKKNPAAK